MKKPLILALALVLVMSTAVVQSSYGAEKKFTAAQIKNNEDLIGPTKGVNLGYGPVGVDLATLVKRMGPKIKKLLISCQNQNMIDPWSRDYGNYCQALMKQYKIPYIFNNALGDSLKESQQIQDSINRGVSGILFYPVYEPQSVPSVDAAEDAGIPVVSMIPIYGSKQKVWAATSQIAYGVMVAKKIAEYYKKKGTKGVCVLSNLNFQFDALDKRIAGFMGEIGAYSKYVFIKTDQNVLALNSQEWLDKTVAMINKNPDVNCIFALYASPAQGATSAIAQTNAKDIALFTIDADQNILQNLKDGKIAGTHPQDARQAVINGTFQLLRLLNGDKNVKPWVEPKFYYDMWLSTPAQAIAWAKATGVKLN